jgi:UDP-GlcNAc:undecaprenyl-phosphate/decaprenyl-phosphate GlcNAc-1-phosphate transferase
VTGYLAVIALAAFVTFLLVPVARSIAVRFSVLAEPDTERRLHAKSMPLLGGAAMFFGFLGALFFASRLTQFHEMFVATSEPIGIVLAAFLMLGVGLIDDKRPVSAPAKLAGQVLAGSVLYLFGTSLEVITLPFSLGTIEISADLAPLVTVLWVVGMANAINLIDGLDGLATGIVGIASVAFLVYSHTLFDNQIISGSNVGPLIAAIAFGVCIGFLPYNFSPASIFMGDAGALFLGLLLAVSTMVVGGRAIPDVTVKGSAILSPLLIPLIILAVPIGDVVRLIVTRSIKGSGVATGNRDHLHYRLLELGHGPRRTVFILCALTAIFSAFVLEPLFFPGWSARAFLLTLLVGVVGFAVLHPDLRKQRRANRTAELNHSKS